jgi:hypothetical protein
MDSLVSYLARTVPAMLTSDEFKKRQSQILETEGEKGRAIVREFEERIKKENFVLAEIRLGPLAKNEVAPIVEGKPRTSGDELSRCWPRERSRATSSNGSTVFVNSWR